MAREASDIDHGWAWVALIASIMNMCLVGMVIYGTGVIYLVLTETYPDSDTVQVAWIAGLPSSLSNFMGPLAGSISTFGSCRLSMFLGGFLCFVGFASSVADQSLSVLFLTIGAIAGIGLALIYIPSMAVIGFYFDKRHDLASGISSTGGAIGSMVGPIIFMKLYQQYGCSGMFLMMGAVIFHACIFSMLIRPSSLERYQKRLRKQLLERTARKSVCDTILEYLKMLVNRSFLLLNFIILLWGIGLGGLILHFPSYALRFGATDWEQSLFWIIFGVSSLASRLISGFASSFHRVVKYCIYSFAFGGTAIVTFCLPIYAPSIVGRLGYAVVIGACTGTYSLQNSLTVEQVGLHNLPMALGIEMLICGIGHLIGPPIGALMLNRFGSYDYTFWCFGGFLLASSLCGIVLLIYKRNMPEPDLALKPNYILASVASLPGIIACSMESITYSIHIVPDEIPMLDVDNV